jgi:ankyrin repeat protein
MWRVLIIFIAEHAPIELEPGLNFKIGEYTMSQEFLDAQVGVFAAAAKGQTEELRSLVEQDPGLVNAYSPDGFTPLGLAVFFGHPETVDALLAAGADVNLASRESMKMPPLGSAMAVQRNDIARTLIEHGANVNGKAANDLTALHTAAARGDLESAKLLLDHGADVNAASTDGKTPLAYAEERNHPDMVEFLSARIRENTR